MRLQFQAKYHWLQSSCMLLPLAIMFCLATNYSHVLHSLYYFATSLSPKKKKLWVKKNILMFTCVHVSLVYIVRRWTAGSYGLASKESVCSAGDLGSIPGLGRSPGEGKGYPTPVSWPGEFHGLYSPRGHKESDTTERLHFLYPWDFSRQEYWSGLPFPPPGDPFHPGIKPVSPALQTDSLLLSHLGSREDAAQW